MPGDVMIEQEMLAGVASVLALETIVPFYCCRH